MIHVKVSYNNNSILKDDDDDYDDYDNDDELTNNINITL